MCSLVADTANFHSASNISFRMPDSFGFFFTLFPLLPFFFPCIIRCKEVFFRNQSRFLSKQPSSLSSHTVFIKTISLLYLGFVFLSLIIRIFFFFLLLLIYKQIVFRNRPHTEGKSTIRDLISYRFFFFFEKNA